MPANWKTVKLNNTVQLQVPPAWKVVSNMAQSYTINTINQNGTVTGGANFNLDPNIAGTGDMKADVAHLGSSFQKDLVHQGSYTNVTRLPDVTINGVELYHLRYEDSVKWYDDFGGVTADGTQEIVVGWLFYKRLTDRKSGEALEAQVMPTYRLL